MVSPADGRVSLIANAVPPRELDLGERPLPRISVFMSVFDCHVNRAPVAGRIERIVYRAGKFLNADLDKASEDNERNGLVIATQNGRVGVVQIAGLVARRILCFVREGETIGAGDRFGMIRFGSRLDIYLPEGARAAGRGGPDRDRGRNRDRRSEGRGRPAQLQSELKLTLSPADGRRAPRFVIG